MRPTLVAFPLSVEGLERERYDAQLYIGLSDCFGGLLDQGDAGKSLRAVPLRKFLREKYEKKSLNRGTVFGFLGFLVIFGLNTIERFKDIERFVSGCIPRAELE